jgi:hypothetical protein
MTEIKAVAVAPADVSDHDVDIILDDILEHIAADLACEMHYAIKMGMITERSKRRLDLYSQVHATEEEMMQSLRRYETEEPLQKRTSTLTEEALLDVEEQDNEDATTIPSSSLSTPTVNNSTTAITAVIMTRHQQNHNDIWNRLPPKEPKKLATCTICNREVSALRFAPHLDKCMQLGSMRGAAAANASGIPNSNGVSNGQRGGGVAK